MIDSKRMISIALPAEQWLAWVTDSTGRPLTPEGQRLLFAAGRSVAEQLKIEARVAQAEVR